MIKSLHDKPYGDFGTGSPPKSSPSFYLMNENEQLRMIRNKLHVLISRNSRIADRQLIQIEFGRVAFRSHLDHIQIELV